MKGLTLFFFLIWSCFFISCEDQIYTTSSTGVYFTNKNDSTFNADYPFGLVKVTDSLFISPLISVDSSIENYSYVKIFHLSNAFREGQKINSYDSTKTIMAGIEVTKEKEKSNELIWVWIQMGISIFSIIMMLMVWFLYHTKYNYINSQEAERNKENSKSEPDLGVFYLASAILIWSVIG